MTKSELITRLESAEKQMIGLQDEIKSLKAKLDEVQDEEIPEFPTFEYGEKYYPYCRYSGNAHSTTWDGEKQAMDYNYFHSAEYHHLFDAKIREIAMLLHCKWYADRSYNPDWTNQNESKWCVVYVNTAHKYKPIECFCDEYPTVYFSTFDAAMSAADWMNANAKRGAE